MNEPLVSSDGGNADNAASTSSLNSSGSSASLLERIRKAQQREQQQQQQSTPSTSLPIPNYAPISTDGIGGGDVEEDPSSNFPFSLMNGFAGGTRFPVDGTQRLLDDDEEGERMLPAGANGEYSMQQYFQMFVMDVYGGFRSLHPALQVLMVGVLLFIVWHLI